MMKKNHLLFILLLVLVSTGCTNRYPLYRQNFSLPPGPICRVAVLPFLNDSDFKLGDAIFSKVFTAELQTSTNYKLVQEGDILMIYQQLRIPPGEKPTPEQLKIIASRANAQLLITGIILEMREDFLETNVINPMLAMEIEIRDGRSGEILWITLHKRHGSEYTKAMHFGTIHTVTGVSQRMAQEIINLWLQKGLKQCSALPQS